MMTGYFGQEKKYTNIIISGCLQDCSRCHEAEERSSAGKRQASCKEIENHTLCRGAIRNIKSGNSISTGTATSLS